MELDGLILQITYDFLVNLQKRGLMPSEIRMKLISQDSSVSGSSLITYKSIADFYENWKYIIEDRKFLCSVGNFPIVQNILINNKNLNFENTYHWYNLLGDRYLVKKIKFDSARSLIYEKEIQRYLDLMNQLIDEYTENISRAIKSRTELYVDPCYVDSGYISTTKN